MAAKREAFVRSMTTLIPPRLSTSFWGTPKPTGDATSGHADRDIQFPEVLAQDMQLSTNVFAAKSMTAGAPAVTLSHADTDGNGDDLLDPHFAGPAAAQFQGAMEKAASVSMVSFVDEQEARLDEVASDAESRSSFVTEGMTYRSVRHRGSVLTAATSLASTSWKPASQRALGDDAPYGSSWINGDSDDDDGGDDGDDGDDEYSCHIGSLSPRPPTSGGSEPGSGATGLRKIATRGSPGKSSDDSFHRKSHSVCGGSPLAPSRRNRLLASLNSPVRPSSTAGVGRSELTDPSVDAARPAISRPDTGARIDLLPARGPRASTKAERVLNRSLSINAIIRPPTGPADSADADVSAMFPTGPLTSPLPAKAAFTRSPSPRPGPRSVQSWLNSSLQPPPYPHTLNNEDLTRVVPLPPEAMETLRVSIACFPETMLLSSSLTIETIRTYSRKVRQPSLELLRGTSLRLPTPESPMAAPRRSLWRNLMPYMRGPAAADSRPRHGHISSQSSIDSSVCSTLELPKPWEPLKNVFGCCSDYICDALYAHIVAYIYMSALVARSPSAAVPASRAGRGGRAHGPGESQQDDIPKKAASLLGLGGASEPSTGLNRTTKRLAPPLGAPGKEDMVTAQPTASASHENMQSGLLHCIRRLVATAKLMAEGGTGEETVLSLEAEDDADMVFVRSLCEIVRMVEEGA